MSDLPPTVLLVEDDLQIRRFLRAVLPAHGVRLFESGTGGDGLAQAATRTPDAILLDLGLPDLDGLEFIRRLREWSSAPVIVLSARGLEHDKVAALDAGADDYLTKPFGVEELLARLRVASRHRARSGTAEVAGAVFTCGALSVDLAGHIVRLAGNEIRLTPTEFKLLAALVRHAGRVVTHRHLLVEVWGPGAAAQTQYLRVQMHGLRHKLEETPARPRYLITEPGVGYRFRAED
jgi:two-component system KDP operon response regulator KdpE